MGNFWTHLVCFLLGAIAMYWIKDNYAKPDILTDVDVGLTVKKNRLFNNKEKRKVFNFLRKKENKV